MTGTQMLCDECKADVRPGEKYRHVTVKTTGQRIVGINIVLVGKVKHERGDMDFDMCGDACLLKHISRLLNQGV